MESLINWNAMKVLFDVLQALFMVLVSVYVWWTNRTRANGRTIQGINKRIDTVEREVGSIKQTVDNMPHHGDMDQLRSEIGQLNRGLAEVVAEMKGSNQLLHRLHDYLLTERGNGR
ncbi:DUF2730 family protein [Modicisalibacter sp. MOD 31.J]|uniref:DUF2730 family protein n=1 Tax=Modicisalibacter sp. MOD 31.J TaxID=2831897 RepID=UPI001CCD4242|nr:DUF2730 family protein [Modicisalibacter sp. MOD 31.J]MBZ9574403.1 DUF2730 family protein [Modicisalibacter sp. MOD 31.J]